MRILIGILLAGAGWPGICLGQLAWAETHLKIQAEPEDKEVIGTFSFQNGGSETVTILNVTSSCGCTVAELDRKVYDPGESGSIRATFSVGSRVGTQIKRITVSSDQDGGSSQVLILETRIPEILRVHPKLVLWAGRPETGAQTGIAYRRRSRGSKHQSGLYAGFWLVYFRTRSDRAWAPLRAYGDTCGYCRSAAIDDFAAY